LSGADVSQERRRHKKKAKIPGFAGLPQMINAGIAGFLLEA
jgi:hypothetical protein